MVHLILVEQLERVSLAMVTSGADPSVLTEHRASFEASLAEPPQAEADPERAALHRALGVA